MTAAEAKMQKLQRIKRCEHVHVSGRRCERPAGKNKTCGIHPDQVTVLESGTILAACQECRSMMQPFTPLKGW